MTSVLNFCNLQCPFQFLYCFRNLSMWERFSFIDREGTASNSFHLVLAMAMVASWFSLGSFHRPIPVRCNWSVFARKMCVFWVWVYESEYGLQVLQEHPLWKVRMKGLWKPAKWQNDMGRTFKAPSRRWISWLTAIYMSRDIGGSFLVWNHPILEKTIWSHSHINEHGYLSGRPISRCCEPSSRANRLRRRRGLSAVFC
jgi:hypothetical protein